MGGEGFAEKPLQKLSGFVLRSEFSLTSCGEARTGKRRPLDERLLLLRSPKVNTTTATIG